MKVASPLLFDMDCFVPGTRSVLIQTAKTKRMSRLRPSLVPSGSGAGPESERQTRIPKEVLTLVTL